MNRTLLLGLLALALAGLSSLAGTQRIMVVGDSWAALMTHPIAGKIFDATLAKNGWGDVEIVATDETAVPGSRADQWASNHKGKLDNLKKTLAAHPTVDVVFVVIGGNDFLKEATARNLSTIAAEERAALWKNIAKNVETLVDAILACRPNLKVVLCDYDYLNLNATAQSPMKQTFQGISQADFNRFLVDLGREKRAVMAKSERCLYIQNWGLMQYHFGDEDQKYEPKTVPLPGGPPRYEPFPGGHPEKPGPAQAFNQGPVNDGIHLNAQGYRLIIENALHQGLGRWLKEGAPPVTRAVSDKPLLGFTQAGSESQRALEARFDAALNKENLRTWMKRMSARPHHVGSPFGKEVAEFIASQFRAWGYETAVEEFGVLFPTPKSRTLEMLEPERVLASLAEPEVKGDTTSGLIAEQLPTYNAYSIDGDVTGKLVYVNYGVPKDYETLAEKGIDVRGKIVIARYGGSWRGIKPKVAAEHGAVGCLIYSDPRDDGYFEGDVYPRGAWRPEQGAQRGSVADIPLYPGDPLTPGIGATRDAKRLAIQNAPTLTKIPVLPISSADALPLLRALQGPVAPEAWRGALPITYHVGPGPATVHLKLEFAWKQVPAYDVIARLRGAEQPDQWIIRGNHHDAWVFGADDPLSGLVALMEEARVIGQLAKEGWRPKRTLVFAAWTHATADALREV